MTEKVLSCLNGIIRWGRWKVIQLEAVFLRRKACRYIGVNEQKYWDKVKLYLSVLRHINQTLKYKHKQILILGFSMKKFDIAILDHVLTNDDYFFFTEQGQSYFRNCHIEEELSPIAEIASAWYERLRYYYFSQTYELVGTDNYHECREFIIFGQYKISNPNHELMPTLSVLNQNGQWENVNAVDSRWHLDWIFQRSSFKHQMNSSDPIMDLIGKLAFRDLFGIDMHNRLKSNGYRNPYHTKLDVPDEETLNITHTNIFEKHIHFLNVLIHTAYGKLEKTEEDFSTKKEYKAYKKAHANPRYIKPWHSKNTEQKINQIFTKLVDKDMASIGLNHHGYISLGMYDTTVKFYKDHVDALNAWKADNKNKWHYLVGMGETKFLDSIGNQNLFSYDNMNQEFGMSKYSFVNKACFRAFLNLPPTLFKELCNVKANSNERMDKTRQLFLYWITMTKHSKIKVWTATKLIDFIYSIADAFDYEKPNAKVFFDKLINVLNIFYECYLNIWNETRRKRLFFDTANHSIDANGVYDFLFHQHGNIQANDFNCFANLKAVHSKSTLKSLINKSKQWHKKIVLEKDAKEHIDFNIPHIDQSIDDLRFEIIKNSQELAIEGIEMRHCIYSFKHRIRDRNYLAFKVESADQKIRASLGINLVHEQDHISYRFNQCYGIYNSIVPQQVYEACQKLIAQLNETQPMLSRVISLDSMFYANEQDWIDAPVMLTEATYENHQGLDYKMEFTALDEALMNAQIDNSDLPF